MNYLELYEKWCISGKIGDYHDNPDLGRGGLCNTVIGEEKISLFAPTEQDDYDDHNSIYWGSLISDDYMDMLYKFNDFRKNVVLFLAAMEGQL